MDYPALIGLAATIGIPTAGGIRYVWNLNSRLDGHDLLFVEREKLAQERHSDLKADLAEIKETLTRKH